MYKRLFLFFVLILVLISGRQPVKAQSEGPIYIVQSGDTMGSVAARFGISIDQLVQANPSVDPNLMPIGTELIIPGLEGVSGVLTSKTIEIGESFYPLSQEYRISPVQLARINRITSPAEAYAGFALVIPEPEAEKPDLLPIHFSTRQSSLELAVLSNTNPWVLNTQGNKPGWSILPGETVYIPANETNVAAPASSLIKNLVISPLPLVQGETAEIRVQASQSVQLTGMLNGRELHFFPTEENSYVAIQGIHAMADPGLVEFSLQVTTDNGENWGFDQWVILEAGYYTTNTRLIVDPATIDYENTQPEDELIKGFITPATETRYWDGLFLSPVDVPANYYLDPDCITDRFGNRRAYNDGPFDYYHTGLDLSACGNTLNIYTVAPGVVVFSGPLTVRGTYTLIDHGWGIYSGYGHQSESYVKEGDIVEAGQLIGLIGNTGRVTGPHLHWEVWANGVQVQPLDWLAQSYPSTR